MSKSENGWKLAFMTMGEIRAPFGHPEVQGFVDLVPDVYGHAKQMPGYLGEPQTVPVVAAKCWGGEYTDRIIATLTLWEDIESVTAFAYHGHHGEAIRRRKEWIVDRGLPEHVAWWVDADAVVDFAMGAERMDHLFAHGSSPEAFTLRKPFDEKGNAYRIDNQVVREKANVFGN